MGFEDEFRRERENAILAAEEVVKVAAFDAFNTAVIISPVGNTDLWKTKYPPASYVGGLFRSSWILSYGEPSNEVNDIIVSASQKTAELQGIFQRPYSSNYAYSNNLPYAIPLDEGHSTQAVNGITDVVAMRINARIPEIERAANAKYKVS